MISDKDLQTRIEAAISSLTETYKRVTACADVLKRTITNGDGSNASALKLIADVRPLITGVLGEQLDGLRAALFAEAQAQLEARHEQERKALLSYKPHTAAAQRPDGIKKKVYLSPEQRQEAVALVCSGKQRVVDVAETFGVSPSAVWAWVKEERLKNA